MKSPNIETIAQNIARILLLEQEMELSDNEKQKQDELADEIKKSDLAAEEKEEKQDLEDLEEEEEEEEDVEVDIEAKPKPDDSDKEGDETASDGDFEVQAPDAIPQKIQYNQIEKQVNNLRAGKSLKDETISRELQDYFKELGTGEKQALFTYLASISAILTGGTSGEDAPRPGNLNIEITPEEDKEKKKEPKDIIVDDELKDKDRTAPIVVGELANKVDELVFIFEQTSNQGDPHRCMNGDVVPFGSQECVNDLHDRISDTEHQRNSIGRGSADRCSLNGTLKFLRQKKRTASKMANQMEQEKLQARLNQADSE